MENVPSQVWSAAADIFGSNWDKAQKYHQFLATEGLVRGLLGPREGERLWTRHILNSLAPLQLIPTGARVADLGSGSGLPGIPLALARSDISVTLIEPLLRRSDFLREAIELLELNNVTVVRARAEELHTRSEGGRELSAATKNGFDIVTSRAVAALPQLVSWCLPLLADEGRIIAIKGDSAESEFAAFTEIRKRSRLAGKVHGVSAPYLETGTNVVEIRRDRRA